MWANSGKEVTQRRVCTYSTLPIRIPTYVQCTSCISISSSLSFSCSTLPIRIPTHSVLFIPLSPALSSSLAQLYQSGFLHTAFFLYLYLQLSLLLLLNIPNRIPTRSVFLYLYLQLSLLLLLNIPNRIPTLSVFYTSISSSLSFSCSTFQTGFLHTVFFIPLSPALSPSRAQHSKQDSYT